jgi:hypothetical protein
MTMLAEKKPDATWLVVVAENTNRMPGSAPELEDIKPPIRVPEGETPR